MRRSARSRVPKASILGCSHLNERELQFLADETRSRGEKTKQMWKHQLLLESLLSLTELEQQAW